MRTIVAVYVCYFWITFWASANSAHFDKIDGVWYGTLRSGPLAIRFALHLQTKDGKLAGTLDSLDQRIQGQPLTAVSFKDGKLNFQIDSWRVSYDGKLDAAGDGFDGEFRHEGEAFLLELNETFLMEFKKVDKIPDLARPQQPKRPLPYREEEVAYRNRKANITFAGTLTIPRGEGPFPAVVLLSGSGPNDRDCTFAYHKPFLVLADYLTRAGIAVLRVDDRGAGKTKGGDVWQSTLLERAEDALLDVDFLKTRKEINPAKIGVIGHSEGALVAAHAASQANEVAFVILLAAPCRTGNELFDCVHGRFWERIGVDGARVPEFQRLLDSIHKVVRDVKDRARAETTLRGLFREELWKQPAFAALTDREQKELLAKIDPDIQFYNSTWYRFILDYDPRPVITKVKCPVLALTGEGDVQVPAEDHLPLIEKALRAGGNRDFTVKELPYLNHTFQTAPRIHGKHCALIEETFAPAALRVISEWILKRK